MEAPAVTLLLGDCLDRMRELPDGASTRLTDPPYGINFMGKAWDRKAMPRPSLGLYRSMVSRLTGSPSRRNAASSARTGSAFANRQVKPEPMTSPRKETMHFKRGANNGAPKRSAFSNQVGTSWCSEAPAPITAWPPDSRTPGSRSATARMAVRLGFRNRST